MSIFPIADISLLQNEEIQEETEQSLGKVYKFDFDNNKYLLKDGKLIETTKTEAIQQFVRWTLKTIIKKYKIYDEDYGMDYSFVGYRNLPFGFVNSELKRQIEEQLTTHPLIKSILNYKSYRESTSLYIEFVLVTTENENLVFNESVEI